MKSFAIAPSLELLDRMKESLEKFPIEVKCETCGCKCRLNKASEETLARLKVKRILCENCAGEEITEENEDRLRYGS